VRSLRPTTAGFRIEILIRPTALAAFHITPTQLATKIEQADQIIAAGRVIDQHQTLPIVLEAQAPDLDALRRLPIGSGPTGPIALGTVAEVVEARTTLTDACPRGESGRHLGRAVAGREHAVVVEGVRAAIAGYRSRAPADVELRRSTIRRSLDDSMRRPRLILPASCCR
jgi:multidrug efflux pump subunit AcrB